MKLVWKLAYGYLNRKTCYLLHFSSQNDGRLRWEDTIIAWTWRRFYDEGGEGAPEILLRFPMCKVGITTQRSKHKIKRGYPRKVYNE